MELTDLRTFIAVVDNGGITRAAGVLNRVPSSVTTRILQFEEELGVRLFIREGKRLLITAEGKTLYDYAVRINEMASEAIRQVKSSEPGGTLRIGALESTASLRLPKPLAEMHIRFPSVELILVTAQRSKILYDRLCNNDLDAVFVVDAPDDERMERVAAFNEDLVLIASKEHHPIDEPRDIACKTILAFEEGCVYRKRLLNWFGVHGMEPDRIVELSSHNVIFGSVAAGMGIAIVPIGILELFPDKRSVSVHKLGSPFGKALTELVWRKGTMSANVAALRACLAI